MLKLQPTIPVERILLEKSAEMIQEIQDPIMQEIRHLDKLVDWLAKGKTVQEVIEK